MKRAATFCVLTIVACGLWASVGQCGRIGRVRPDGWRPQSQHPRMDLEWRWQRRWRRRHFAAKRGNGNPPMLFTDTVPTNVFFDPWSFTGKYRFAGNSQEEFGRMMFVDDGTNIWHLSFLNTGNDPADGIYNGGNPTDPIRWPTRPRRYGQNLLMPVAAGTLKINRLTVSSITRSSILTARVASRHVFYVNGADVSPVVSLLAEPSKFPAGTIGFGSLNIQRNRVLPNPPHGVRWESECGSRAECGSAVVATAVGRVGGICKTNSIVLRPRSTAVRSIQQLRTAGIEREQTQRVCIVVRRVKT